MCLCERVHTRTHVCYGCACACACACVCVCVCLQVCVRVCVHVHVRVLVKKLRYLIFLCLTLFFNADTNFRICALVMPSFFHAPSLFSYGCSKTK